MARLIEACRVCGGPMTNLWELGDFALCGYFPDPDEEVPVEPMGISSCDHCTLVQMHYSYDHTLYGENYGYRSGLNPSMIEHLRHIAAEARGYVDLHYGDTVIDIGGNDGTLLNNFGNDIDRILIDPTAPKWAAFRDKTIKVIPHQFFGYEYRRAKLIFSIAMFYDLENPVEFARQVAYSLSNDGIWVLEQSYLPDMVENNAFDTICHEHLEYYSLTALRRILDMAGLRIYKTVRTPTNGGSLLVYAGLHGAGKYGSLDELEAQWMKTQNDRIRKMAVNVDALKVKLHNAIQANGRVYGYGASTKGNTLLQYMDIKLPSIVDVNPDKWGKVTPGTKIPIVSHVDCPDAYIVLPWHFREFFLKKEKTFMENGGKMIFPLPDLWVS